MKRIRQFIAIILVLTLLSGCGAPASKSAPAETAAAETTAAAPETAKAPETSAQTEAPSAESAAQTAAPAPGTSAAVSAAETAAASEASAAEEPERFEKDGFSFRVPAGFSMLSDETDKGSWTMVAEDDFSTIMIERMDLPYYQRWEELYRMSETPSSDREYRNVSGADTIVRLADTEGSVVRSAEICMKDFTMMIFTDGSYEGMESALEELLSSIEIGKEALPYYAGVTDPASLEKAGLEEDAFVYNGYAINLPKGSTIKKNGDNVTAVTPDGNLIFLFQSGASALFRPSSDSALESLLKDNPGFTGVEGFGDYLLNDTFAIWYFHYGYDIDHVPTKIRVHGLTAPNGMEFTLTIACKDDSLEPLEDACLDTIRPAYSWEKASAAFLPQIDPETGNARFNDLHFTVPEGYDPVEESENELCYTDRIGNTIQLRLNNPLKVDLSLFTEEILSESMRSLLGSKDVEFLGIDKLEKPEIGSTAALYVSYRIQSGDTVCWMENLELYEEEGTYVFVSEVYEEDSAGVLKKMIPSLYFDAAEETEPAGSSAGSAYESLGLTEEAVEFEGVSIHMPVAFSDTGEDNPVWFDSHMNDTIQIIKRDAANYDEQSREAFEADRQGSNFGQFRGVSHYEKMQIGGVDAILIRYSVKSMKNAAKRHGRVDEDHPLVQFFFPDRLINVSCTDVTGQYTEAIEAALGTLEVVE